MIQFENSEHIVIIEDDFVEAIIKAAQWWKERLNEDIEKYIVKEVISQIEDRTEYISFHFEVDDNTAREIGHNPCALSFIISKENVTLRKKWKGVMIKKGSPYEKLNDNPKFINALTRKYNMDYDSFVYYLPVRYEAPLISKDGASQEILGIHVDIPFSDIEVCE